MRKSSLLVLMSLFVFFPPSSKAAPSGFNCASGQVKVMNIVAHQDDDILFLSPDLLHDVQKTHCILTVYVTAGDASRPAWYWVGREFGAMAAYSEMLGETFDPADWGKPVAVNEEGQPPIQKWTIKKHQNISLAFMHLADPDVSWDVLPLKLLWEGKIKEVLLVEGSYSPKEPHAYGLNSLKQALSHLIEEYKPDQVNTLDCSWPVEDCLGDCKTCRDHSDHTVVARIVKALKDSAKGHQAYAIEFLPSNLTTSDAQAKRAAFCAYANFDTEFPGGCTVLDVSNPKCNFQEYNLWLERQYPAGTPVPKCQ